MNHDSNIFAAQSVRKGRVHKVIAFTLAALMVFCFMPAMAWQGGDAVYANTPDTSASSATPDADTELAALKAKISGGGDLANFAWDNTNYPSPAGDIAALEGLYEKIGVLKAQCAKIISMDVDWATKNSDENTAIDNAITSLTGQYDTYKKTVSDYIDAVDKYVKDYQTNLGKYDEALAKYQSELDESNSEYNKQLAEYEAKSTVYNDAVTALTTALATDLLGTAVTATVVSISPVKASVTTPDIYIPATDPTTVKNPLNGKNVVIPGTPARTIPGTTNTFDVPKEDIQPYAQDIADAAKAAGMISYISDKSGISLDIADLENSIRENITGFAGFISAAAIYSPINTGDVASGGKSSGVMLGISYDYDFTFVAQYVYTIPEATKTAAQGVILNDPGTAPVAPTSESAPTEPAAPDTGDLTTAWSAVYTAGLAAASAFAENADDETNSDYETVLGLLNEALAALGAITATVKATLDGDGNDLADSTIRVLKEKDSDGDTKTIDLDLDYSFKPSGVGFTEGWTVTSQNNGVHNVIQTSTIKDGQLILVVDNKATGSAIVTLTATVTPNPSDGITVTVEPLSFTVEVYPPFSFNVGKGSDEESEEKVIILNASDPIITTNGGMDDALASASSVDSTENEIQIDLTNAIPTNGVDVEYTLSEWISDKEPHDRITVKNNILTIEKGALSGDYIFKLQVTNKGEITADAATQSVGERLFAALGGVTAYADSDPGCLSLTVCVSCTNAYCEKYTKKRAELVAIQTSMAAFIARVNSTPLLKDALGDSLENFKVDLVGPLDEMWNNGNPSLSGAYLEDILGSLNGIVALIEGFNDVAGAYNYDVDITALNSLISQISKDGIPIDQELFVSGGAIDISRVVTGDATDIFAQLSGLKRQLETLYNLPIAGDFAKTLAGFIPEFDNTSTTITIPSILDAYVEGAKGLTIGVLEEAELSLNILSAYDALQAHVAGASPATLASADAINTYIQGLYTKYDAFHKALGNFEQNSTLLNGVINGLLANAGDWVEQGLTLADGGKETLLGLLDTIIKENISDETLQGQIEALADQAFDAALDVIGEGADLLPKELSLSDIVGYSAQLNDGLRTLSEVSALITAAVNAGIGFDWEKIDLTKLEDLDNYLLAIYKAYYEAVGKSVVTDDTTLLNPADLQKWVDDLKTKLMKSGEFAEVKAAYLEILEVYKLVNTINGYLTGTEPLADVQTLIGKLESLKNAVETLTKITGNSEAFAKAITGRIDVLIDDITSTTTTLANIVQSDSVANKAVKAALSEITGLLGKIKQLDYATAYEEAEKAYLTAKEVWFEITQIYALVDQAITYFSGDSPENDFKAAIGKLDKALDAIAKLMETTGNSEEFEKEITARVETLIAIIENAPLRSLADASSDTSKTVNKALDAIAELLDTVKADVSYASIYSAAEKAFLTAKEIYLEATSAYEGAVGVYKKIETFVNTVISGIENGTAEDDIRTELEALKTWVENAARQAAQAAAIALNIDVTAKLKELEQKFEAIQGKLDGVISRLENAENIDQLISEINSILNEIKSGISANIPAGVKTFLKQAIEEATKAMDAIATIVTTDKRFNKIVEKAKEKTKDAEEWATEVYKSIEKRIPDPRIQVLGSKITTTNSAIKGGFIKFSTNYDWLFGLLEDYLGVELPVYKLAEGGTNVFDLSKDGILTLKDGVDSSDDGVYSIKVVLKFSSSFRAIENELNKLFAWENTVTIAIPDVVIKGSNATLIPGIPATVTLSAVLFGEESFDGVKPVFSIVDENGRDVKGNFKVEVYGDNGAWYDVSDWEKNGFLLKNADAQVSISAITSTTPGAYTYSVQLMKESKEFGNPGVGKLTVILSKDRLRQAIAKANTVMRDTVSSVAAISKKIAAAEKIPNPTPALVKAIEALAKALEDVRTSRSAISPVLEDGIDVHADHADLQSEIDKATNAITEKLAALAKAIEALAAAEEALDAVSHNAKPTLTISATEVWIYDNAKPPLAAPTATAKDEANTVVAGSVVWVNPYEIPPAGLGQTKAARFTPDEIGSYGAQPFDVTVNVVIKSTIDKAIEDAKYVLGLINDNGWLANGTVSQAAFDALNNALTAATTASGKPASAEVIAEINGALSALNAALGVVTNDLGEFITPQPVPGAPSGGMQQSSGPVSTTTVVNSKLRVTFNARGGAFTVNGKKVGVNTIEVDPGQKLSNLPKPTRENYRFAGWFYAKQKSTTQVTEGATITSRLTLRAKWHRIAYIKTSKAKLILKTMPSHKTMALKKDKKVYILGKSVKYKNYLKVRYGKKWGWVLKTSLVLQSTKYAKKATWVKKKASAKAEKLAKVKKNGKFTVIGVSGNYYQVKYKKGGETVKGYVPKKNLKKTAPTTAATAEEAS